MRSDASTVEEYLAELPDDRREAIKTVRQIILDNLPEGYEEAMNWGMITYQVPLERHPDTYNGKPLMYAALASQKNHMAVYLTPVYMDDEARREFEAAYRATGKRYDAVVCTGTFTYGHVKANAFDELVRVTRPGGIICFTIREGAYEDYGYRQRMIELEQSKAWELLSMQDADYLKEENIGCKLCTYKVLS